MGDHGVHVTGLDHVVVDCADVEATDFEAVKASGRFEVRSGPATRWGARGDATSLYISDPDGNTIELRYYEDRRVTAGP